VLERLGGRNYRLDGREGREGEGKGKGREGWKERRARRGVSFGGKREISSGRIFLHRYGDNPTERMCMCAEGDNTNEVA